MMWDCERCDTIGGVKEYGSPERARKFAAAFDVEDNEDVGRRAPLLGMFPLRMARYLRRKSQE